MIITRHRNFKKNYQKRILPNKNLDKKFEEKLKLFIVNPNDPELKDHKLLGTLRGLRSFSITGGIRVIYRRIGNTIELYDIGNHNQVY